MAHTTKYFEGIQDLPTHRYFDLNLAMLMESSAGGGINGIVNNLSLAIQHQNTKEHDKATTLISNLLFGIAAMQERQGHTAIAHAAMVSEYEGKPVGHLNAEAVAKLLEKELTPIGKMRERVSALKKKWRRK